MIIHFLSGFLGSGKTTAIRQACKALMNGNRRVAVITNDQGEKLVDGGYFNALDIPGAQVANGCFCCNYNDLVQAISSLAGSALPEVIFAESVGSCTDIAATVLRPLQSFRPHLSTTLSTFADIHLLHSLLKGEKVFDDSVTYIFFKQLEEAGIVVINKTDLADSATINEVRHLMESRYPDKALLFQHALDTEGIGEWLGLINHSSPMDLMPLKDIDYDIYGAGEAMLAWCDKELGIFSDRADAPACAKALINSIHDRIRIHRLAIGHLKFLVNGHTKISFAPGSAGAENMEEEDGPATHASLLINARVLTDPPILDRMVNEAIKETEKERGCRIQVISESSFQPGYPVPVHRM